MNAKEFKKAFDVLVNEKNLDADFLIDAMSSALSTAYKKNFNETANIRTVIDTDTGNIRVYKVREVVDKIVLPTQEELEAGAEEVNPNAFIELKDAKELGDYKIGDEVIEEVTPADFDRVAVSVAKQVVIQKLREAERNQIMKEFEDKENELMVGFLAMEDVKNYYVDLGKSRGILPKSELIPGEKLTMGDSIKVYITKIENTTKGPLILLSRKNGGFVKRLFELEIPEFNDGTLIMQGVAREAGVRSKVAVYSTNSKVEAIGACVGEKGRRIANIIKELNGEKIDLILYDPDIEKFVANALSPAKNLNVSMMSDNEALVIADTENLSLAIGKKGVNIKLASKLTRVKINIKTLEDINKEINEK